MAYPRFEMWAGTGRTGLVYWVTVTSTRSPYATAYGYRTVVLSYLSVTLAYCGQIRIPLGTEVGLGQGDIVLDWDPAPLTGRETAAPTFLSMSIVAKHHIETTDAGLDGLCIREINVYHTKRSPISATAQFLSVSL